MMRQAFLLLCLCVTLALVTGGYGQTILLVGNVGSFSSLGYHEDTLDDIHDFLTSTTSATVDGPFIEDPCTGPIISNIAASTYDMVIYMKYANFDDCPAVANGVLTYVNTGGLFLLAGSVLSSDGSNDNTLLGWFGATVNFVQVNRRLQNVAVAPSICDTLLQGFSEELTTVNNAFSMLQAADSCARFGTGAGWAVSSVTTGTLAFMLDGRNERLFGDSGYATYRLGLMNLVNLASTNGGVGDPHIFSKPIFGSHSSGSELVSLLEAHSLSSRDSLLESRTWVKVADNDDVEVLCLLGGGLRKDGLYFTDMRIEAGDDSIRLASVAEGSDLLLSVHGDDGLLDVCLRGSEEQLHYVMADGQTRVTVVCDADKAHDKFAHDGFMMAHSAILVDHIMAMVEVHTDDYVVVAYYVQQNFVTSRQLWIGAPTAFFNVEAHPLADTEQTSFGGLFGNRLEAGMDRMRSIAASPEEAKARLVASFLQQE